MSTRWIALTALAAVMVLGPRLGAQESLPPEVADHGYADLILVNGKIVSMDNREVNSNPGNIYEEMAVKGERIIALGASDRIRKLGGSQTTVVTCGARPSSRALSRRTRTCSATRRSANSSVGALRTRASA